MTTSEYDSFAKVYNEVASRGFGIIGIEENNLIGRLIGKPRRRLEEHKDLEIKIKPQGDLWILDVDDSFFCNKIYFLISRPEVSQAPVFAQMFNNKRMKDHTLHKIICIGSEECRNGIYSGSTNFPFDNYPNETKFDEKIAEYVRENVQKYKDMKYQIIPEGFSEEELKLSGF